MRISKPVSSIDKIYCKDICKHNASNSSVYTDEWYNTYSKRALHTLLGDMGKCLIA